MSASSPMRSGGWWTANASSTRPSSPDCSAELQRVVTGFDTLTAREREVLALMAEGRANGAISNKLFLSKKTVEAHIRSIFLKLDLTMSPDDDRRVLAVLTMLRSMP